MLLFYFIHIHHSCWDVCFETGFHSVAQTGLKGVATSCRFSPGVTGVCCCIWLIGSSNKYLFSLQNKTKVLEKDVVIQEFNLEKVSNCGSF